MLIIHAASAPASAASGVTASVVLATQVLDGWGASAAKPAGILWIGPVSALVCAAALLLAVFYPPEQSAASRRA